VHFCLHAAAPTASRSFVEQPVETIDAVYQGTANMLALARQKNVESMLYISSMEVYGTLDHVEAREDVAGALDPLVARSSYPQAKRLAETLCAAYVREYDLPVKIARPTLAFGPGVRADDQRVFMQFARAAIARGEIRLATSGATERDYIYTADACRLLLAILLKGENGQAYNVANPDTYMSILDLARTFQKARPGTTVKVNTGNAESYAPETHIRLNVEKARKLDEFEMLGMGDMVERLLGWLKTKG
jgi:nucleoside-diphosphate-sugar epimerase